MRKLLVVATLVVSIGMLLPMSALAYLSPDQVFGNSGAASQPPPTQREGDAIVEQQQQRSAELRNAAQENLVPNYADPEDTYVPAASDAESRGLFDDNAQYERRMDRIEDSHGAAPTIIIGGDGTIVDANGNVLRSGAPIASTGPESVLAVFAVLLAGICTFAYSGIRQRQIAALS